MNLFDVDLWKRVLSKPVETFDAEKQNASYRAAFFPVALAALASNFFLVGASVFLDAELAAEGFAVQSVAWFFGMALGFVFAMGVFFISSLVTYEVAVLLGSHSTFRTHVHATSLFVTPLLWLGIPVGLFLQAINLDLGGSLNYASAYYGFLAFRHIHGFSTGRTVLLFIVASVLLVLAAIILFVALSALAPGLFSTTPAV